MLQQQQSIIYHIYIHTDDDDNLEKSNPTTVNIKKKKQGQPRNTSSTTKKNRNENKNKLDITSFHRLLFFSLAKLVTGIIFVFQKLDIKIYYMMMMNKMINFN